MVHSAQRFGLHRLIAAGDRLLHATAALLSDRTTEPTRPVTEGAKDTAQQALRELQQALRALRMIPQPPSSTTTSEPPSLSADP